MDGPSEAPSVTVTVKYVTYQVPTILAPMTQEARVTLFQRSWTATLIKVSFGIAFGICVVYWGFVSLLMIPKLLEFLFEDESDRDTSRNESVRTLAILFVYGLVQFFAYSPTLYAVVMIRQKKPKTIRFLAWVSLLMLIAVVGFDLYFINRVDPIIIGTVLFFILVGHIIFIAQSIVFLCKLSQIFQNDEVQVPPDRQANVNPVTSMQVENQSN